VTTRTRLAATKGRASKRETNYRAQILCVNHFAGKNTPRIADMTTGQKTSVLATTNVFLAKVRLRPH